jgi:excisionase family DNA binding protein
MKLTIGQVSKELGVTVETIRRWEAEGRIVAERTKGGHRRYDFNKVLSSVNPHKKEKLTIGYARVSTANKKDDLSRQVQAIELYCAAKGWRYRIISDIGSGLNYNKKGLEELITLIETNQIQRLVLNYKDRLLRFGSEIIFNICKLHDVEVEIINNSDNKNYQEELVEDVLSIITVFSAKLYGSRSHKNKKIVKQVQELLTSETNN